MSKETIVVLVLIVVAFFGGYYFSKNENGDKAPSVENQPTTAIQQADTSVTMDKVKALFNDEKNLVFGNKDSKLLFVVVSDPSCPYCHAAAGKNPKLNKDMGDRFVLKSDGGTYVAPEVEMKKLVDSGKAGMVWMYANGHGAGELATEAMYCANEQGKFWEVHDKFMSFEGYGIMNESIGNDRTKIAALVEFVGKAADSGKLKSCLDSGKYTSRISENMATARQIGFEGTPYYLINTTRFVGAYSYSDMQSAVDEALK